MSSDSHSKPNPTPPDPALARYSRQILYDKIGVEGQRRLRDSHVVLFGCGALGTVLANTLVRAGVGFMRICDRDFIERDNLQRQALFDEDDIAANLPKAQAAANKLRRINSEVTIEPVVVDVNPTNVEQLAHDAELLLDGTDNFETRFLINDLAVQSNRPWIYGAVIGGTGLCMTIIPRDTPCLRCVFEEAPPPEMNPTCDTAGVLGPAVNLVASLQAIEAVKLLIGRRDEINRHLVHLDVWSGRLINMKVQSAYDDGNCPCCKRGEFPYLEGKFAGATTTLCGRDAVQVVPGETRRVDFEAIAAKLRAAASSPVRHNAYMLRARIEGYELTLFPDARVIIKGTHDPDKARSLYAKYFGA
ncbi:MAG: ThiF family adenylyltransferase [Phycisphaerales bacterium]|nr:ThiF family adenylyltransferase [Phycisphaerales bacterium]